MSNSNYRKNGREFKTAIEGCNYGNGTGMLYRTGASRGVKNTGSNCSVTSEGLKVNLDGQVGYLFDYIEIGKKLDKNGKVCKRYFVPYIALFLDEEVRKDCISSIGESSDVREVALLDMLTTDWLYKSELCNMIYNLGESLRMLGQVEMQRTLCIETSKGEKRFRIYLNTNGVPMDKQPRFRDVTSKYLDLTSAYIDARNYADKKRCEELLRQAEASYKGEQMTKIRSGVITTL